MPPYRATALVTLVLLAACTKASSPQGGTPATIAADDTSSAMVPTPETHLFDLADSTQVWLVTGREAHSSTGGTCLEQGIQLRKGPLKIPVPLLYTSTMPEVVNGKLVAKLSKDCVSGASYAIDPKTGQPTLMAPASR
ncbi:MAG TPA: hypothetical protein VL295_09485 [Gemmatimonadales bacterium]|nr:hypothetical protein [Gemmatimonadales bacterium]